MDIIQTDKHGFKYYKNLPNEYTLGKSSFLISMTDFAKREIQEIKESTDIKNKDKDKAIEVIRTSPRSYHILPNQTYLLYSELQQRYDICTTTEHNSRYIDMLEWKEFINPFIKSKRFYVKKITIIHPA